MSLLAAIALAVFLAGCAMPPYNEELSLAQVTRSKLGTAVNKIGPIYAKLDDGSMQNQFYFLPERGDPVDGGGFLVAVASYGLRVWYLADYSGGLESSWPIDLANSSETANNYLLQPIERSDSNFYLSLTRYLPNDLRVIRSLAPSDITNPVVLTSLSTPFSMAYTVGSSVFPDTTAGSDSQYFLTSDGVGNFREFFYTTSPTAGIVAGPTGTAGVYGPLPYGLTNGFCCHDPNADKSYLSYWSGSSYITYSWTWDTTNPGIAASAFQQLSGIDGRVEAVLSNGQLLAFDEGACTAYSPTGGKLYKFPLGALKFCYERYDGTTPKVYFSLAYWLYGWEDKADQLYVEVYAIPTASLKNLD